MRKNNCYALYYGDIFLNLGSLEFLSDWLGVSKRTIYFYSMPTYLKRSNYNSYVCIKIEEE